MERLGMVGIAMVALSALRVQPTEALKARGDASMMPLTRHKFPVHFVLEKLASAA